MITIKTAKDIDILREGGKRHAEILKLVLKKVVPNVTTKELDDYALKLVLEGGDKPAFLGYRPEGAKRDYPASLCVSINQEIVHGIPNEGDKILREGDVVGIDLGLIHKGLYTDMAITVGVGKIDKVSKDLIEATRKALDIGVKAVKAGKHIGDIGFAIEEYTKTTGFSLAEGLAGHGVGYKVHEDPYVPNSGEKGQGEILKAGMVIAIEPMLCEGTGKIVLEKDGYTYSTKDGKRSAHFEHTVLVTDDGFEILTM